MPAHSGYIITPPRRIVAVHASAPTRGSECSRLISPTAFGWDASNVLSYESRWNGHDGYIFHQSTVQRCTAPRDFTGWSTLGTNPPTVTAGYAAAPDGAADAAKVVFGASNNSRIQLSNDNFTASSTGMSAFWVWTESGTKGVRVALASNAGGVTTTAYTATTTPTRRTNLVSDMGVGTSSVVALYNEVAGGAGTVIVAAADATEGPAYILPHNRTGSGTLAAVNATLTGGAGLTDQFLLGDFQLTVRPYWIESDLANGDQRVIFDFTTAGHYLLFDKATVGGDLTVIWGDATGGDLASGTLTLTRHADVTITCRRGTGAGAASLTIDGALTGDGTTTGTGPKNWPRETARWGANIDGTSALDGVCTEIVGLS